MSAFMKRWTQPSKPYQNVYLYSLLNALPQYNNVTVYRFEEFGNTNNKRLVYNFFVLPFFVTKLTVLTNYLYFKLSSLLHYWQNYYLRFVKNTGNNNTTYIILSVTYTVHSLNLPFEFWQEQATAENSLYRPFVYLFQTKQTSAVAYRQSLV